ncbi:uncharacterized protein F4812DRAFT_455772 [Daldinia caldariorum]|uniref:uncharacterized protein n=1 Tax=Daldinia caldariorum TaxID=326644 RepID=UPI002008124C|nr:uncharacterized protein F4812DRAFT_455772 [Daldinia caldariorum]KAI1471665.1 hypothetical protein F4812DRAFT_455772 [Daldinia caldariorum]
MAPPSTGDSEQDILLDNIPQELYDIIIKRLLEDTSMCAWFKLRSICRSWKAEIEKLFAKKYLSKTTIEVFDDGVSSFSMKFDSLLENDTVAVFKSSDSAFTGRNLRSLVRGATTVEGLFERSFHLVTVADEACSDPKLDGLQVNIAEGTASLPWIPMMSQVLGDEVRLRRRTVAICDSGTQPNPQARGLNSHHRPLKLGSDWSTNRAMRPMLLYSIGRVSSFKTEIENVRNSRIIRQYHLSQEQDEALANDVGTVDTFGRIHKIFLARKASRSQWIRLEQMQ